MFRVQITTISGMYKAHISQGKIVNVFAAAVLEKDWSIREC